MVGGISRVWGQCHELWRAGDCGQGGYDHLSGRFQNDSQSSMQNTKNEENIINENYDIALAMSSSRADPVLGHCPGWGYLNI